MTTKALATSFYHDATPCESAIFSTRFTRLCTFAYTSQKEAGKTWQPQGPRFWAKAKIKLALCSIPSAASVRELLDWGRMTIDDGEYCLGMGKTLDSSRHSGIGRFHRIRHIFICSVEARVAIFGTLLCFVESMSEKTLLGCLSTCDTMLLVTENNMLTDCASSIRSTEAYRDRCKTTVSGDRQTILSLVHNIFKLFHPQYVQRCC